MSEQYEVFLSYSHADAKMPEGELLINTLRDKITQALKPVCGEGRDIVFLDTHALTWGDTWHARIISCLNSCKIFVYVLSPNYLASDYCRRERLWWAQKQMLAGRLFRGTLPIYYVDLSTIGTYEADRTIREVTAIQASDKPFFESIGDVRESMILERLRSVLDDDKLREQFRVESLSSGFCSIRPRVSKYFVGRLAELSDLTAKLKDGKLPVICADGGIGKSELAVAYAYAFADRYPGGRFLFRMEGIKNWTDVLIRMLSETSETETRSDFSVREYLCIPDDFNRLEPAKQHALIIQKLLEIAREKPILLLLDNVDDCSLLKDESLQILFNGKETRPEKVHLIATTRQRISANSLNWAEPYELLPLQETDAFELVCSIADNKFNFAKKPPEADDPEYQALMRVIAHLGGNAWALEVIAGFMSEHYGTAYNFQCLEKNIKNNVPVPVGKGCRLAVSDPAALLQPTLDRIADKEAEFHENGHILELAKVAALFPPEQIPLPILEAYWTKYFGNEILPIGDTCHRALELLRQFHILNGEENLLKMHRLTHQVLRQQTPDIPSLCKQIGEVIKVFVDNANNPSTSLLESLSGFYLESLQTQDVLKQDNEYLTDVLAVCDPLRQNNLLQQEISLLNTMHAVLPFDTKDEKCYFLVERYFFLSGMMHSDINHFESAEKEFNSALVFCRQLEKNKADRFYDDEALILTNIAKLHREKNQLNLAEKEYNEAISIQRELVKHPSDKFIEHMADTLNCLAILHYDTNRLAFAEKEHNESLNIQRALAEKNPEKFSPYVAYTLNCLGILHKNTSRLELAENEFNESLKIRRFFAKNNPEKFNANIAYTLCHLANLHYQTNHFDLAEREFNESLQIRRDLTKKNPEKFSNDLAYVINNLAKLHRDIKKTELAEAEFKEALKIKYYLAKQNPQRFNSTLAYTLHDLAGLHYSTNHFDLAEKEFNDALQIRRSLAAQNPAKFNGNVANNLSDYAELSKIQKKTDKAEDMLRESLQLFRDLAKENPQRFEPEVAKVLDQAAQWHCSGVSLWKRIFSAKVRAAYKQGLAEAKEALAIAERYPENPKCKEILERWKKFRTK